MNTTNPNYGIFASSEEITRTKIFKSKRGCRLSEEDQKTPAILHVVFKLKTIDGVNKIIGGEILVDRLEEIRNPLYQSRRYAKHEQQKLESMTQQEPESEEQKTINQEISKEAAIIQKYCENYNSLKATRRKLKVQELEKIIQLRRQGKYYWEIGRIMKMCHQYVAKHLDNLINIGLDLEHKNKNWRKKASGQ